MVMRRTGLAAVAISLVVGSAACLGGSVDFPPLRRAVKAVPRAQDSGVLAVEYAVPASISDGTRLGGSASTGSGLTTVDQGDELPPARALEAYQRADLVMGEAAPACHLSWTLVAAVGSIESNHGRVHGSQVSSDGVARPAILGPRLDGREMTELVLDTDVGRLDGDLEVDRAVGPMQFIPSTWTVVAVDGDGDGMRDPQDIDDAALAAAVFLCAWHDDLATDAGRRAALLRYNRSTSYADRVLEAMSGYEAALQNTAPYTATASAGLATVGQLPALEQTVEAAEGRIWGIPSHWEPPPPPGWGEWFPTPAHTPAPVATDTTTPPAPSTTATPGPEPAPTPGDEAVPAPAAAPTTTPSDEPPTAPSDGPAARSDEPATPSDEGSTSSAGGPVADEGGDADPTAEELAAWRTCTEELGPVGDQAGEVAAGECLAAALGLPSDDARVVWLLNQLPSTEPA